MERGWTGIGEWLAELPEEVESITVRTGDVRGSLEAAGRLAWGEGSPVTSADVQGVLDDIGGGGRILRLDAYGSKGRHVRGRERTAGSAVAPAAALVGLALPAGTDPLIGLVVGVLQAQSMQSSALVDRVITSNERLVGMLGAPFEAMTSMFREMREEMRGERMGREQAEIDARALETLVEGALNGDGEEADPLKQAVADAVGRLATSFTGAPAPAVDPFEDGPPADDDPPGDDPA